MPKYFETKSKSREEHDVENNKTNVLIDKNNNEHEVLACEDEKEEEKEHHASACEEEFSVIANEEMHEREEMKSNDNGIENETSKELKVIKSNVYESEYEEDIEKECPKCKTNKETSSCIEAM